MPSSSAFGEVALPALIISAMLGPVALVGVGRAEPLVADLGADNGGNLEGDVFCCGGICCGCSTKVGVAGVMGPTLGVGSVIDSFGWVLGAASSGAISFPRTDRKVLVSSDLVSCMRRV